MKNQYKPMMEDVKNLGVLEQIVAAKAFLKLCRLPCDASLNQALKVILNSMPLFFVYKGGHHIAVHLRDGDFHNRVIFVTGEWLNDRNPR